MPKINISIKDLSVLVSSALERSKTDPKIASTVAKYLVKAEMDGKKGHGLSRVKSYCLHSNSGKVDGYAFPKIVQNSNNLLVVDASFGFAYPAFEMLIDNLSEITNNASISMGYIINSHHFGVAGHHVENAAENGKISILFGNTPSALIPWGGKNALFGTNPIAFGAPNKDKNHLIIDMALSKVSRGKILKASQDGEIIPSGWGLDINGNSTTEPKNILNGGGLLPFGDAKGSSLAIMVEVLTAVISGGNFSFQASSMFDALGGSPKLSQLMIMIDPSNFLNIEEYFSRLNFMFNEIKKQPNTRIPGSNRLKLRQFAFENGMSIERKIIEDIESIK